MAQRQFRGSNQIMRKTISNDRMADDRAKQPLVLIELTSNIGLSNGATIDGQAVTTGDRVGCFAQTTAIENGIYIVDTSGSWTRDPNFESGDSVAGSYFTVQQGDDNENSIFMVANNSGSDVVGTDVITVTKPSGAIPTVTYQNGIEENAGVVEQGGSLVKNTNITSGAFSYEMTKTVTGGMQGDIRNELTSRYAQFRAGNIGTPGGMVGVDGNTGDAFLKAYNETSGDMAWLHGAATELYFGAETAGGANIGTWAGVQYSSDYSANFVSRSLVDKGYVDGLVDTTLKSPDGFATTASADYPSDYKGTGSVSEGDYFYVTDVTNGTLVGTRTVNVGDSLVALVDAPGNTDANWVIMESNRDQATETVMGVSKIATQTLVNAGTNDTDYITPLKLATWYTNAAGATNGLHFDIPSMSTKLGGVLDENTTIDLNDGSNSYRFRMYDSMAGTSSSPMLLIDSSAGMTAEWQLGGEMAGDTAYIKGHSGSGPTLELGLENNSGDEMFISFRNTGGAANSGLQVLDDIYSNGAFYDDDYHVNGTNNHGNRWIPDVGYVNSLITAATLTAGDGLTLTGTTLDVVAADLSLVVNANDMAVNIGSTNGTSLAVSATGLELAATITGARTFSDALTVGAITIPNTDGTSGQVLKTDGSGTLTWQDDAAGKIIQQDPESTDLVANLASGQAVHTLSNLGTHATVKVTNVQLFYNGQKQRITSDYTVNDLTGVITILFDAYTGDSFDFEYNIQNA